jgi:hypothetical protein
VVGSQGFTVADKKRAFSVIRRVQPYGPHRWHQVAVEYNREARAVNRKDRDGHFLKKYYTDKVTEGYSKPDPLDDLNWEIREATEIQLEIERLIRMGQLKDSVPDLGDETEEEIEHEQGHEVGEGEGAGAGAGAGAGTGTEAGVGVGVCEPDGDQEQSGEATIQGSAPQTSNQIVRTPLRRVMDEPFVSGVLAEGMQIIDRCIRYHPRQPLQFQVRMEPETRRRALNPRAL